MENIIQQSETHGMQRVDREFYVEFGIAAVMSFALVCLL